MTNEDANILIAMALTEAAVLSADRAHFEELGRSGSNFPYDPKAIMQPGTPYAALLDEAKRRGLLK